MKEDNINRILDLGVEIMNRKGYHQLGLKELLNTAGIPKGSFYYYFDSKEDFGKKVISHYAENTLNYMSSILLDKSKSPGERLLLMFKDRGNAYKKSAYREGCIMGDCSNELAGQYESIQLLLENKFSSWSAIISECITEGQDIGEFKHELPPEDLADFILNSWEGALTRMKAARSNKPFELFIDYTMNVLLKP
ncbi:MAG: TetR family transcriptional regulator C-terminal domain-containing protein, partial [Cyclobacteriaceae bacterium]